MNYRLSESAKADYIRIYVEGVSQFGVTQAERYADQCDDTFLLLAENPMMGKERSEFTISIRTYPFGSHIIIYKINSDKSIFIIRIRHAREDWENVTDK